VWTPAATRPGRDRVTCGNACRGVLTKKMSVARVTVVAVEHQVEVRRSAKRRRTVSAYRDGDRTVVLLPARMSKAEEEHWVATMLARLAAKDSRRPAGDDELRRRALALSRRHLDGTATPASVRWVTNQRGRWGSCTPADRTIRLSHRLRELPDWVVDYVLVHELAHLLVADHSAAFWALVGRYPLAERARGYLLGVAAAHPGLAADADEDDPAPLLHPVQLELG
jgi:predicted metal-dependent hydrolase